MSNIDILRQGIEDFGIEASDKMLADFQKYKDILVEWNQKMNLTGIEDEKEVYIKIRDVIKNKLFRFHICCFKRLYKKWNVFNRCWYRSWIPRNAS